jgi:Protein of unknown function (DUF5672)
MTLSLPDVTLVCVETREHELAALAVADCMQAAEFGDVLVLTDKPSCFPQDGVRFHAVPDWPSKLGWSRSWWFDVPPLLRTRQTLNIQWDSWIWDTAMWDDQFLAYDYIGAPWWYKDGKNVGNGGFSLVSTRLKRYIADRRWEYPCDTAVDDDLLCRKYRPRLEQAGFRWAPERVAHQFAFECCRPSHTSRHFGFHAMFNWPEVLEPDKVNDRLRLAFASPGIRGSYIMKAFCQKHPGIIAALQRQVIAEEEGEHGDACNQRISGEGHS